jgi:hypothetical protein
MARIRIVDEWLRSPASPPTHYRSIMVVAERWAEQRVLMRAYAEAADQTRPTIVLHGTELAIGPAGTDPNGSWGIHVQPPIDGRAQELQGQLELAAKRMAGAKHSPPRLEDEAGGFERKRTNNWAPGSPRDLPEAPIARSAWDPAVAASQHLPAYVAASPGASTIAPMASAHNAAVMAVASAVSVPLQPAASYAAVGPAAEVHAARRRPRVEPRGGRRRPTRRCARPRCRAATTAAGPGRQPTGVRHARTALGFSSGAGAQSAIIRLGLRPAAARRLGRLAEATVPPDFQITSDEREVLNLLAERDRLTARAVRELVGVVDAVAWMEALMAKLESYGLDLVAPGEAHGSEPTYQLRA